MENSIFPEIKTFVAELRSKYAERNNIVSGIENIYLMNDPDLNKKAKEISTIVKTMDTDARNKTVAAHRLLAANRPHTNIPFDKNDPDSRAMSDEIERFCDGLITASDRVTRKAIHSEMVLSMLLFDDAHVAITSTADMLEQAKNGKKSNPRIEQIASLAPFVYECMHPAGGYPDYDGMGMRSYYRETKMTAGAIVDRYGKAAYKVFDLGKVDPMVKRLTEYTLCEFWDWTYHFVWIDSIGEPIIGLPHKLKFIPIVCNTGEGSALFSRPDEQREPFLMTEYKSGLWQRRNMMMTVLHTMIYNYGFSPLFKMQRGEAGNELPSIKRLGLFEYIDIPPGAEWDIVLNKGIIDPAFMTAMAIDERKGEESTIANAAIGGPAGDTFSELALMSQLGRLPLETYRREAGRLLADVLQVTLKWIKEDGLNLSVLGEGGIVSQMDYESIPDNLNLEVELDVALPQDMLKQASVLNALKGVVPMEDLYEKVLKLGQYKDAQGRLTQEKLEEVILMTILQRIQAGDQNPFGTPQPPQQQQPPPGPAAPQPGFSEQQFPAEQFALPQQTMGGEGIAGGGTPPPFIPGEAEAEGL